MPFLVFSEVMSELCGWWISGGVSCKRNVLGHLCWNCSQIHVWDSDEVAENKDYKENSWIKQRGLTPGTNLPISCQNAIRYPVWCPGVKDYMFWVTEFTHHISSKVCPCMPVKSLHASLGQPIRWLVWISIGVPGVFTIAFQFICVSSLRTNDSTRLRLIAPEYTHRQ